MEKVYILKATGCDAMTGVCRSSQTSTIVFPTRELAERWIPRLKRKAIEQDKLTGDQPIEVEVIELDVVDYEPPGDKV